MHFEQKNRGNLLCSINLNSIYNYTTHKTTKLNLALAR